MTIGKKMKEFRNIRFLGFWVFCSFFYSNISYASFRCNGRVIEKGLKLKEVLKYCSEHKDSKVESYYTAKKITFKTGEKLVSKQKIITDDKNVNTETTYKVFQEKKKSYKDKLQLLYDLGEQRFLRVVHFVEVKGDDSEFIVEKIESLPYKGGFLEKNTRNKDLTSKVIDFKKLEVKLTPTMRASKVFIELICGEPSRKKKDGIVDRKVGDVIIKEKKTKWIYSNKYGKIIFNFLGEGLVDYKVKKGSKL